MGNEEIAATRVHLGWTSPPFEIPADIRAAWDMREKGARVERRMAGPVRGVQKMNFPRWPRNSNGGWRATCPAISAISSTPTSRACSSEGKPLASRQSSQATLNAIGPALPELLGGSADLTTVERHAAQGFGRADAETPAATTCISACANSGMSAILKRYHGARWLHSLRRDLPDVLGLRPQCRPDVGVDAPARHFSSIRTTPSDWAKTADAPAD